MRYLPLLLVFVVSSRTLCQGNDSRVHAFSVLDSIKMTTFSDPYTRSLNAVCKESPDGRYVFIVTSKGIVATDQVQSTIWLFDVASITAYLNGRLASAPQPKSVAEITEVPRARQPDAYGATVTKARWTTDSTAVLFLAETHAGTRRLSEVKITTGAISLPTPANLDVEDFTEAGSTIVYTVKSGKQIPTGGVLGEPINRDATALTGLGLPQILNPERFPNADSLGSPYDVWVSRGGKNTRINISQGRAQWHYPSGAAATLELALSPDGRAFIGAEPAKGIPGEWKAYKSAMSLFRGFDTLKARGTISGGELDWPWLYTYVNIDRRTAIPIANAPNAAIAGYGDRTLAAWSRDSSRALITNTFLPVDDISLLERDHGRLPCAVAVFTVSDKRISCVSGARYPQSDMRVVGASFGRSPSEVVIDWGSSGNQATETYRDTGFLWIPKTDRVAGTAMSPPLKVYVHQDINRSPTLWATDMTTARTKEVWNPNPQLSSQRMGEASLYRWRDSSGYDWKGGLIKPPGYAKGKRYPLVIQTHGFSEHEFLVDGSFTTGFAARPLAAAGIVVLQMGGRTDRATRPPADEAPSMALGFRSAIEQLTKDELIDPARVGIIGFSRTSWYVESVLESDPNLFKAATVIDGIDQSYMTYRLFCPNSRDCTVEKEGLNGGSPLGDNLGKWMMTAPGFHLDKVQVPLRVESIGILSILQEWEVYSSLLQQGKPVDFIYLPNGQHILQKPMERLASQQGNVDWFRFWLQGYEDPDPSKRRQYERWRIMRRNELPNVISVRIP